MFQMKELHGEGIIHAKTRCWAQGMDGWRPLQGIPQLKWCLMASGQAVMNESDLATLILNMLNKMCEYYPSRLDSTYFGIDHLIFMGGGEYYPSRLDYFLWHRPFNIQGGDGYSQSRSESTLTLA